MTGPRFLPRRELGRTGFQATRIGIGDLADRNVPLETCVATLRRALEFGLNLIDTAPGYESGYSEEIVGAALKAHAGPAPFVIDKIDELGEPVAPQLAASLARLGRDSVDAFVFHSVSTPEAYEALLARGALQELDECRRQGQCRFVGFSSHHPEVLQLALSAGWADVLMFPIGPYVDARYTDEILPRARELGVGTVCFKTFGAGKLLGDTEGYGRPLAERPRGKLSSGGSDASAPQRPRLSVDDCVRYTLTLDPDVALLGMSFPNEQDAALAAAERFQPLDERELAEVRERARAAIDGKGPCWWNPPG